MNLFFETCDFLRKQGDFSILNFFLGKRELKKLKTIFFDTVFFALFNHVQINGKRFPLKLRISCTLHDWSALLMNLASFSSTLRSPLGWVGLDPIRVALR